MAKVGCCSDNNKVNKKDIENRADIELIVRDFYQLLLADSIVGFIFSDVAKIDLQSHLPIIADFWSDIVFANSKAPVTRLYHGNTLQKHLELNRMIALKPGHFTRWLYLFSKAVEQKFSGSNADLMKHRAEIVARSISAAISERKKGDMQLTLPS